MGGGAYGNQEDLERTRDYLQEADPSARDGIDRRSLPPSLRHMNPDDEIDVIVTSSEGRPDGAGEYLGVMKQDTELSGGGLAKAGMRIWRNARKSRPGVRVQARDILEVVTAEQVRRLGQAYRQPFVPDQDGPVIPAGLAGRQGSRLSGPDGEINVTVSAGPEKPLGAGRHLGVLREGFTDSKGQRFEPGWHVWAHDGADRPGFSRISVDIGQEQLARVLDPASLSQPAAGYSTVDVTGLSDESARFAEVMEEVSPGLTARLAAGLGQDELSRLAPEIARAMTAAHHREQELAASWQRASELIAGRDSSRLIRDAARAEAVPLRANWTADQVLDMHAWLARHYTSGSGPLADYLGYLMRTTQEQFSDPDRLNVMFWPVELGKGPVGPVEGGLLAGILAHGLHEARTYQVTAPMVAQMREVSRQVSLGVNQLDGGEMPSHAGFAWLDQPWTVREAAGYFMPFRAVSWEKVSPVMAGENGRLQSLDAVRVVLWTLISDDMQFGRWDDPKRADRAASQVGQLTPQHVTLLPFGRRFRVNEGFEEQGSSILSLIHLLWAFLGMELSAARPPSSPHTAARARRSLKHTDVHVVTLRRISYISDELPGHRDVTRTCRWWVGDFRRHIDRYDDTDSEGRARRHEAVPAGRTGAAYEDGDDDHDVCAVCLANGQTVRITQVRGHIRGPSYLPLKPQAEGRTLHRLSR